MDPCRHGLIHVRDHWVRRPSRNGQWCCTLPHVQPRRLSIQITFDTYGHLFPQARTEASARLENQMFRGQKRPIVRRMLENGEIGDSEEGKKERVN